MSGNRSADSTEDSFQFIVSRGPRPDPAARKIIRRQAMKEVGLSRRRRNHGQPYEKQVEFDERPLRKPVHLPLRDSSTSSSSSSSKASRTFTTSTEPPEDNNTEITTMSHGTSSMTHRATLPQSLDSTKGDYWHARSNSGIDLSSLTILTNFNIGKSAISALASSPSRLATVLDHRQWSYLDYIPQRYPHSPCLAAATDCILARVGNILSPRPRGESSTLRLYAKTLRLVQNAVASSNCLDPDVLCAVQLLSLNELFDASSSGAWDAHVEGSARLIRCRSVGRFETEFEKALFAASVGPFVSQCLYNATHCYLALPHWKELYLSLAVPEPMGGLSERSGLAIGLRSQILSLPGLWHDIGHALEGDDLFDDDVLYSLAQRCQEAQAGYLESLESYKAHVLQRAFSQPSPGELALRREVYGLAHECLILVKRLQASVCDTNRLALEAEVQDLVQNVFKMQHQPLPPHSWLFSGHELGVAQLALDTSDKFTEDVSTQNWKNQRIAMRRRYVIWSSSLRAV